jgi:hypothetical protein
MRLKITCLTCLREGRFVYTVMAMNDTGLYEFTCENGHCNTYWLQAHKFEVLAEVALQAILDGYYREAILSFNTSLERFYEYCARFIAHCYKHDESLAAVWKNVSAQSERQFGLYLGLYMMETGKAPAILPQKMVEIRNAVVHKGVLPTRDDAVRFGQAVIDIVQPIYDELKKAHTDEWWEYMATIAPRDIACSTYAPPMVYNALAKEAPHPILEEIAAFRLDFGPHR